MEVSGIGNDVLYTGQTNSTLASVTYRTKEQRIPFGACTIMMNDQSSGALSSSTDKICPVSFELSIQRQMEQDFTACGNTYTQAGITQQPVDNGHIETTLTLELPEYTADDWLDDLDAGTVRKAQLTVTGDVITNFNRELDIYLPGLVPADAVADINGADRISNSLTFQAVKSTVESYRDDNNRTENLFNQRRQCRLSGIIFNLKGKQNYGYFEKNNPVKWFQYNDDERYKLKWLSLCHYRD